MKTPEEWIELGYFDKKYATAGEFVKAIQKDALTEAANIVDQCHGEESDLRVVRDKIKNFRDFGTDKTI